MRLKLIGVISLVLLAAGPAFADVFDIFPVDSIGSTTPKTEFEINQVPFIYLHLPHTGLNVANAFWNSPSGPSYFTNGGPQTGQEYWFSLNNAIDASSNPVTWLSVRETGNWNVGGSYLYTSNFEFGGGQTSFTVTPEPATAMLFFTGGLALFGGLIREKRQAV